MANRSWHRIAGALEIESVMLWTSATIGASGAVSSFDGPGKGVTSVTKLTAAGQYKVNLEDSYNKLLFADVALLDSADSDPNTVGCIARIKADASSSSPASITIQCFDVATGAPANPNSGAKLLIKLEFRNSSVS